MTIMINKNPKGVPVPPAKAVKAVVVHGTVDKHYKDGSSTSDKELVKEALIPEPHATVGLSMGVTRSTGNFESVKAQISLFIPCSNNADDIEATYYEVKDWVDGKVTEFNNEVDSELGK